ncbi:MAG: alkaline phosphatase family protein [Promethearchaeia archaeon]
MNKINHVILCIIDDVRSTHFFGFIKRGLLPNFERLMKTGLYSKICITDFPSVTYPTQPTIVTGTYTGDYRREKCHGIPSYSWMGRNIVPPELRSYGGTGSDEQIQAYKLNADLGPNCQTLLEMIKDGNCTSLTQFLSRGTDYLFPESKVKLAFYYLIMKYARNVKKMMTRANTMVVEKLLDNFQNPQDYFETKEAPIGSFLWFMSADVLLHLYGYDSYIYKLNLLHIDKVIGNLIDGLDEMGYLDQTAIAVTTDHGNYKGNQNGNVEKIFNDLGFQNYHPRKFQNGIVNIAEYGGVGLFYFKSKSDHGLSDAWYPPSIEELRNFGPNKINVIERLTQLDTTQLLYFKDNSTDDHESGTVHLRRKERKTGNILKGTIEFKGSGKDLKTKYTMESEEGDIFGYLNDSHAAALLDNRFHTIDEWLDGTYHVDYPLYIDLIPRHFKNPRSSDVIVSTQGKTIYNIAHGKKKNDNIYTHDIGLRKSAVVPLLIGGSPEIPKKEISYCKTTDIVPTLCKLLGITPHKSVIGKSLL